DAGVDGEAVPAPPQTQHRFDRDTVVPARRAGVPRPTAPAGVRRQAVNVPGEHERFDLVAGDLLGRTRVADGGEQVQELDGPTARPQLLRGLHHPARRARVLAG